MNFFKTYLFISRKGEQKEIKYNAKYVSEYNLYFVKRALNIKKNYQNFTKTTIMQQLKYLKS